MQSKKSLLGQVSIAGVALAIHPKATQAFEACCAMPAMLELTYLPLEVLQAMLQQQCLIITEADVGARSWWVVGGFRAYQLVSALEFLGERPAHVMVSKLLDQPTEIQTAIQAELSSTLIHFPGALNGQAIVGITKLLRSDCAVAIFGRKKPNLAAIQKVTKIHRRHLLSGKPIETAADSSILRHMLDETAWK